MVSRAVLLSGSEAAKCGPWRTAGFATAFSRQQAHFGERVRVVVCV
jgi:hypothetical protein